MSTVAPEVTSQPTIRIDSGARLPVGAASYWEALVRDSGAFVAIIDQTGVVHFANARLASLLGAGSPDDLFGRRLEEITPAAFADERLGFIRRAIETRQPLAVDGVWRGAWLRTTFRPMPADDDGRPRVLLVASPAPAPECADGAVRARVDDLGPLAALTKRETDILRMIGRVMATADIARVLYRSVKTIEGHRVSMGNKLGISNRVELARIAIRAGLCSVDQAADAKPDEA